ncbi:MAG: hypothetical protein MMC33_000351 [Icmadophila ericetorum]|nr:hypothetical protein [Icmadophila ericetorum]
MPAWLNDVSAVANDNGTFNPSVDPTMAFLQTPTSSNFEFNNLQTPQLQQRMQNGVVRNGSPAYLNPAYQTQSIVPSKRPRPRDDGFGTSPRQAPGALPSSRSQTPQQTPYGNFQPNVNGGPPLQAPTPFQHLQHGPSSNASPSPVMQDHHFNQGIPQRMQTASPSPFSPVGQNYGSQVSPPQSDYGSRVDTPQNGNHPYMQGPSYMGSSNQHVAQMPGNPNMGLQGVGPSPYGQNNVHMQQNPRMWDMRQQQLYRQLHASSHMPQNRFQGSHLNPNMNPNINPSAQMAYNQQAQRAQQMQTMPRPANAEQLRQALAQFMAQRNLPLNMEPIVGGRPVQLVQLWSLVMKEGGSKKVMAGNRWIQIAMQLQFSPMTFPTAAQELQNYWQINLAPYEMAWWHSVQQRNRALNNQSAMSPQVHGGAVAGMQDQFSPVRQLNSQHQDPAMMHARRQSGAEFQTPVKQQMLPQQVDMRHNPTNGFSNLQQAHVTTQQNPGYGMPQPMLSLPPQAAPPNQQQPPYPAIGAPAVKKEPSTAHLDVSAQMPRKAPMGPQFLPRSKPFSKGQEGVESHRGIHDASFKDLVDKYVMFKPTVPKFTELGVIDIRALIMSLRSGLHAEVRLALDTLTTLSYDQHAPALEECEDLIETLIDCAEEQVDLLAENAAEVSDVMLISPYEEVVRGCRAEVETLQDIPEFGSLEYDLDRSVDRLTCITTILRNFSFYETNHRFLADSTVVKFMTTVIRYLGTRNMLLRTHRQTLDFTKDVVTYLSNVSHSIDLPGKEEASCILHFLLSFAPSPPPTHSGGGEIMFSLYNPSIHRYLPPAVDSLAKLLARDDPNRTFYKSIFAADSSSSPPYDLLTRTFALAVAPIPELAKCNINIVEARKPYLAQGMLAAEILITLIPGAEHTLARSWLNSQDGFAMSLLQLITLLLNHERAVTPTRQPPPAPDASAYDMVTHRAISVLRKLVEKGRDSDDPSRGISLSLMPRREDLLLALMTANMDSKVVRQLCVYAELDL